MVGRFINADDTAILQATQDELLGGNLFAYCGNCPVMYSDPSGHISWFIVPIIIVGILLLNGCTAKQVSTIYKVYAEYQYIFAIYYIYKTQKDLLNDYIIHANNLLEIGNFEKPKIIQLQYSIYKSKLEFYINRSKIIFNTIMLSINKPESYKNKHWSDLTLDQQNEFIKYIKNLDNGFTVSLQAGAGFVLLQHAITIIFR